MKRRRLLLQGAAVGVPALLPLALSAQPAPRRVGVLAPSTAAREAVTLKPFFDEMARLGWEEGKQVVCDRAFADDRMDDLPQRATELVARRPELIYAPPQTAAVAARGATTTIPIVFATATDPVGAGLVASPARPGGNATGIGQFESLAPKSLQLLREMLPKVRRVGLVGAAADPRLALDRAALQPLLGPGLQALGVQNPAELDAALQTLLKSGVEAIFTTSSLLYNQRERIIELTLPQRVPVVGHRGEMCDAGALFSYGASLSGQIRASAQVVDKVLRGASPAQIPVQQPTTVELLVNQRTATTLGITVPRSLLLRAERVIE
jgi:putative tryptophan/tyrosine transport system substrate-binding protein